MKSCMETCDHWTDIETLYDKLSREWYKDCSGYAKAKLERLPENRSKSDGYSHDTNTIQINAPQREIDPPDTEAKMARICGYDTTEIELMWPKWKSVLVHEAIHEYEKKVIKNDCTNKGRQLHAKNNNKFICSEKHGEAFYTAVADRADYFGKTAEDLVESI